MCAMKRRKKNFEVRRDMTRDRSDEVEIRYPFCLLPENYFHYLLSNSESETRTLFSIRTWDGREILSVDTVESEV